MARKEATLSQEIDDRAWSLVERLFLHAHGPDRFVEMLSRAGIVFTRDVYAQLEETTPKHTLMSRADLKFSRAMEKASRWKQIEVLEKIVFDDAIRATEHDDWNYYGVYIKTWLPDLITMIKEAGLRIDYRKTEISGVSSALPIDQDRAPEDSPGGLVQRVWKYCTRGWRRYVVYPLTILFLGTSLVAAFLDDSGKIKGFIGQTWSRVSGNNTVVASKNELEILDEWVLVLEEADSPSSAIHFVESIRSDYLASGNEEWKGNFLSVRHPAEKDKWLVVLDARRNRSTKDKVFEVKAILKRWIRLHPESEDIEDGLGRWLKGSYALDYRVDVFEGTYGRIKNR